LDRAGTTFTAAAILLVAMAAGPALPAASATPPARIASMNPCTDQLVWMLVDPARIVSLSHLAIDPEVSTIAGEVNVRHLNHGEAEEILPLNPDLVLNGPFSHKAAALLLQRLGYRVVEVDAANSDADIRAQLRELAKILGAEARAETIIAAMDARIAELAPPPGAMRPTAVNYQPNGFTAGAGTLVADILDKAGFALPGGGGAWRGYRQVPLERLVIDPPDVLIIDNSYERWPTLAQGILSHPVFQSLNQRTFRVALPNRLWVCGTPATADAIEKLTEVRRAWLVKRGARP